MRRIWIMLSELIFLLLSSLSFAENNNSWRGIHLLMSSGNDTEILTSLVKDLAEAGINTLITEVNYGYEYKSHPELRTDNPSTPEQIKKLVSECKKHKIRLIPQFQCLGHQSWSKTTYPLLLKYPQFDETPGKYPNNEGIYCRSWCPLHPEVNTIIFDLMDELIDVFEADALHVGMDEVFLIGEKDCSRCQGKDKAELFAKAVNDYHKHIVGHHKIEMLMWGDRLIDASKIKYGSWEASDNHTASAIDSIPKDIIICDWHYEPREAYESIPMFIEKGFRVLPASWRNPESAKALVDYSIQYTSPKMLGHLNTIWGTVPIEKLTEFEPVKYATKVFGTNPSGASAETTKDSKPVDSNQPKSKQP